MKLELCTPVTAFLITFNEMASVTLHLKKSWVQRNPYLQGPCKEYPTQQLIKSSATSSSVQLVEGKRCYCYQSTKSKIFSRLK